MRFEEATRPARVSIFILSVLAACDPASLKSLQTRYDEAQAGRTECSTILAASAREPALAVCDAGKPNRGLADIAQAALQDAGKPSDPRTQIAQLRLAAVAGWQSGLPAGFDAADAAALQGEERCNALSSDQFGAPRDCALLRLAPAFVAHERSLAAVEEIAARGPATATAADRDRLGRISEAYMDNAPGRLERVRRERLEQDSDLSPELLAYATRQRTVMFCTVPRIVQVDRLFGDEARAGRLEQRRAAFAAATDPQLGFVSCAR